HGGLGSGRVERIGGQRSAEHRRLFETDVISAARTEYAACSAAVVLEQRGSRKNRVVIGVDGAPGRPADEQAETEIVRVLGVLVLHDVVFEVISQKGPGRDFVQ